ncbi:MAG: hypothetical protein ACREOK_06275, partial [Gemmatimonadaceae bacterium]
MRARPRDRVMKYFVRIGTRDHEVTIDDDFVALDGRAASARLEDLPGSPMQLVTIDGAVHRLIAHRAERGVYELSLDGHRFTVEALDERARVIRELSGAGQKAASAAHLNAPMPGLIVR